ncbi:type II secretion system F family protein [Pirellulales bacterium]|nr:type II secretion system F family protein [Pirellulales bacterium]
MAELPLIPTLISCTCAFFAVFYGSLCVGPAWDEVARRRVASIAPRLIDIGVNEHDVTKYLRLWGVALFGVFTLFGILLGMLPIAVGLVYLVYIAPTFVIDYVIKRRSQVMRDQMVRASVGLANAARAGLSLPQGLENVSDETPQPMAAVLKRIVHEYKAGRPLTDALTEVRRRLDLEAFTMFSAAITVCLERGGKVTYALDRISETLHETQRLERKLEADSASGRKLALTLGCFPIAFLVGFTQLDPEGMSILYNTLLGQLVLLGVGVTIYFAIRWCMKILDVDM